MAITAVVFLGTFYPVIMEAVAPADKISVGPPYYNLVFVPLTVPLLMLVTVGPMLAWKRDSLGALWLKLRLPLAVTVMVWGALWAALGAKQATTAFGLALGFWLILGGALVLLRRWKGPAGFSMRLVRTTPAAVIGMALAHAGLGVTTAGISMMSGYATSKILVMRPGESTTLGSMTVSLTGVSPVQGPNYQAVQARFSVDEGRGPRELSSERRFFSGSGSQTTEAGIGSTIFGNAYIAIGDEQRDAKGNGIVVRIYRHPLVGWIWFGGLMMAMGGAASLADRRFRIGAPTRAVPRLVPTMVPAE
jgi:cytochrome c-type biogenesis protein CcmF